MIKKYRYGAPFDTEALTEKIETAEGAFPYGEISQNDGFAFTYIMDEDDIVYGLGESNRGINKRGYCYISNCTDDPNHTEDNRSCAFHSGNLNGDNYGNNKTIQKNVERNFTNVFDWKPFRDSSAWRCNQRVSTCEFDPVICVCQYGNHVAQSVPGVPDMQLNPCC